MKKSMTARELATTGLFTAVQAARDAVQYQSYQFETKAYPKKTEVLP